jgi:hypothetical protein
MPFFEQSGSRPIPAVGLGKSLCLAERERRAPMRILAVITLSGLVLISLGCSSMHVVERENLVDPQLRADYIESHPDGKFNENIVNGEIKRGMFSEEVIASWGFPNVLLVDKDTENQYWVYYTKGSDSGSVMIYTLNFDKSNLADWDIEIKRYNHFSLDSKIFNGRGEKVSLSRDKK